MVDANPENSGSLFSSGLLLPCTSGRSHLEAGQRVVGSPGVDQGSSHRMSRLSSALLGATSSASYLHSIKRTFRNSESHRLEMGV